MDKISKGFVGRTVRAVLFIILIIVFCTAISSAGIYLASRYGLTQSREQVPLTALYLGNEGKVELPGRGKMAEGNGWKMCIRDSREVISRTSNARCPVCHKKMELKGKGDAQIFVCRCGHKEKLKAFEERRKKEGAGVTKKDVARYLNQQKKEAEEPVNNAFAKALAGLNLKDKG